MELKRDEIIKALECCKSDDMTHCRRCPYDTGLYCMCNMSADALSLINELTEENERLRAIPEQLHKEMSERIVEERKIERKLAVREMQERLNDTKIKFGSDYYIFAGNVDVIAEEMLEGVK